MSGITRHSISRLPLRDPWPDPLSELGSGGFSELSFPERPTVLTVAKPKAELDSRILDFRKDPDLCAADFFISAGYLAVGRAFGWSVQQQREVVFQREYEAPIRALVFEKRNNHTYLTVATRAKVQSFDLTKGDYVGSTDLVKGVTAIVGDPRTGDIYAARTLLNEVSGRPEALISRMVASKTGSGLRSIEVLRWNDKEVSSVALWRDRSFLMAIGFTSGEVEVRTINGGSGSKNGLLMIIPPLETAAVTALRFVEKNVLLAGTECGHIEEIKFSKLPEVKVTMTSKESAQSRGVVRALAFGKRGEIFACSAAEVDR